MNSELLNALDEIDSEDKEEKKKIKNRLFNLEKYKEILSEFTLTVEWFHLIDPYITEAAYLGCKEVLFFIKESVLKNIKNIDIITFNEFLKKNKVRPIWNHIDLLKNNRKKINWEYLSGNPVAIDLLRDNIDCIFWDCLSYNTAAISLLEENEININWNYISSNTKAIELINKRYKLEKSGRVFMAENTKLNWDYISENSEAIDLIKEEIENARKENRKCKVNWEYLSMNTKATHLIRDKIKEESLMSEEEYNRLYWDERISWKYLSRNTGVVELLMEELDNSVRECREANIDWYYLNMNINAVEILKKEFETAKKEKRNPFIDWSLLSANHLWIDMLYEQSEFEKKNPKLEDRYISWSNKIDWAMLCRDNIKAVKILKKYPKKILWDWFSSNPAMIETILDSLEKVELTEIEYDLLFYNKSKLWTFLVNSLGSEIGTIDMINWESLCENNYDYNREKINKINTMFLFTTQFKL